MIALRASTIIRRFIFSAQKHPSVLVPSQSFQDSFQWKVFAPWLMALGEIAVQMIDPDNAASGNDDRRAIDSDFQSQ
jgi:hypothetical protein